MQDLRELDTAMKALVSRLAPARRRTLMMALAREMMKLNQARMAAQKGPDGAPWADRKAPPRRGRSHVMMARLRRFMKATATANEARVGFSGRAGRIAAVHHFGKIDEVSRGGPRIRYEMRELIGFADGDLEALEEVVLNYISH